MCFQLLAGVKNSLFQITLQTMKGRNVYYCWWCSVFLDCFSYMKCIARDMTGCWSRLSHSDIHFCSCSRTGEIERGKIIFLIKSIMLSQLITRCINLSLQCVCIEATHEKWCISHLKLRKLWAKYIWGFCLDTFCSDLILMEQVWQE